MKMLLLLASLLLTDSAFAADLRCEAWYAEHDQEKTVLPMEARATSPTTALFTAEHEGYAFAVTVDFALDVMYIDIEQGMPRTGVLFVTAKLPTTDVYQLTDLHLPLGPRLAVKCTQE